MRHGYQELITEMVLWEEWNLGGLYFPLPYIQYLACRLIGGWVSFA